MKGIMLLVAAVVSLQIVVAQELPPTADPGKCYIKCIAPDEFKEVVDTIVVSPAYKKLTVVPATFKTVTEKVVIQEASKRYVYVPATYDAIDVDYDSKDGYKVLSAVPAAFGNDSKTMEVYPKVGKWEYKVLEDCPSANKEDCMVACFVEHPPQKETFNLVTLTSDARVNEDPVPAKKKTYKKLVIKEPARVDEVLIPEKYGIVKRLAVDQPASTKEVEVPAETKLVTRRELEKKGGMTVWEEVDCSIAQGPVILPILYELNSALITARSRKTIDDNLLVLMRDKSNLRIEIMSHTDSRGNDEYNLALSQQRAQAVVNYLAEEGISRNRLVARGYGESRLKNRCANSVNCTEQEHQANRRTEFRILQ